MAATYNLRCRSNKPYRYSSLDATAPTIRLLEVLPVLTRGQLSLSIKHVSLADAKEQYHTLSYTWGNDEPSHRVYIDSQYLSLRENVWSFLMHHYKARSTAPRWLWIDSVCINQSDVAEKNQQVSMMGLIFCASYGTLIWLNELSERGPFAVSFQRYESTNSKVTDDESELLDTFLYGSTELKISEKRKTLRRDAIQLFEHDYWRRLWVVQEIILSKRIWIVLGWTTINLDLILRSIYDSIRYHQDNISGVFEDPYLDYALQRLCTNRMSDDDEDKQSLSLLSLVQEYGAHGCKDVRDRVYGLLGLTCMSDVVVVDYNCHIMALFADTLQSCVARREDFGPKRENMHMYDVSALMRALHIYPNVLLEYQNREATSPKFIKCFKIEMFPTVVYVVDPQHGRSTFLRLIDANDKSVDFTLSMYADRNQDYMHGKMLSEICNLDSSGKQAQYLLCGLPLSGFQTLLRVHQDSEITLVGTIEHRGMPNAQGNLLTPCSMPSGVLENINQELSRSRTEFCLAAFEQKVEWPGYIVRCSVEELVHLQGSHDRLDPGYLVDSKRMKGDENAEHLRNSSAV